MVAVSQPHLVDRARWAFRSRVYGDPGGAWGVHPGDEVQFEPVDWTVTRALNEPATAQVIIDPDQLTGEQRTALRGLIGSGPSKNRTFGLSCFRDDFKEEDAGDAIFFGPITTVDMPSNGPVTIQAKDMMYLANGILVGSHDLKNVTPEQILDTCQAEWVRQFPRASGLDFKGNVARRTDYKVEIADLKTLADVIADLVGVFNFVVYHDRSVDLQIVEPDQTVKHSFAQPGAPTSESGFTLVGSSITRLFGPESQPNVIRVAGGDNSEEGRKVATSRFVPNGDAEFVTGLAIQGSHGVKEAELARVAESFRSRYQKEALTASIKANWMPNKYAPRPGEWASAVVHLNFYSNYEENELSDKRVTGVIQSVTITQDFYEIDITTEG